MVLFLLVPALIIWASSKLKLFEKIGIVLLSYMVGIVVGNLGILPASFTPIQSTLQDVSVVLALPLLLFSLDVKSWIKLSKSSLISIMLAFIAIIITTLVLQLTIGVHIPGGWKFAGMSVAVYSGGTPNLAAIKTALNIDSDTYILFNTYDTVFSLIYIFFMVSVARQFFQKVFKLKPFDNLPASQNDVNTSDINDESIESYSRLLNPSIIKGLVTALLLTISISAIAVVIGGLFPAGSNTAITILLITTFGIAASFIKPINRIRYTFQLGMYIIYVFSVTVASMTKLSVLLHINWTIFLYVSISILGSMILHALFSKLFKIDSDTMIVTSVAAVCSPPFVPVVVSGLKNRNVLISGLVTGIIGYAVGNYLGISIAMLFRMIFT